MILVGLAKFGVPNLTFYVVCFEQDMSIYSYCYSFYDNEMA